MQIGNQPYQINVLNNLEFTGLVTGVVTLLCGLVLFDSSSTSALQDDLTNDLIRVIATLFIAVVNVGWFVNCAWMIIVSICVKRKKLRDVVPSSSVNATTPEVMELYDKMPAIEMTNFPLDIDLKSKECAVAVMEKISVLENNLSLNDAGKIALKKLQADLNEAIILIIQKQIQNLISTLAIGHPDIVPKIVEVVEDTMTRNEDDERK